jgi:probable HAF family extracellular repeat protein
VNDESQVLGDSFPSCASSDTSHAFLWDNGYIVDLNTLVPPNSPLLIFYAYNINNRGEIAVNGIDAHGIEQAALLIPGRPAGARRSCDPNGGVRPQLLQPSKKAVAAAGRPRASPWPVPRTVRPS